eukprot:TRINITY_DN1078_c0_g1_i1.p2 TRINITY_DN1078_c0_g1~~TRINITY_DN1078_c0_g1_i1.p2  ORF type:complete len:256 (-),score=55.17 TRINITY_DN1078_c0_g1_i1:303-1070(-)
MSSSEQVAPFKPPAWATPPSPSCTAVLSVQKSGEEVDTIDLAGKPFTVFGRHADVCDVVLDHPSVSRKHAAMVFHTDGRLYLIDLQSAHGTFLNGERIKANSPTSLKNDHEVRFGASTRSYILQGHSIKREREDSSSEEKSDRPSQVRCRHLLVKHKDSRRPSSWKTPVITITKEEALEKINEFREMIVAKEVSFEELASTESDCSSAKKGGDLGFFGPGQMQKSFEDASFALKVGELSKPVFSDSGVHLILRVE